MLPGESDGDHRRRNRQCQHGEPLAEPVEPAFERRCLRPCRAHQAADGAKLGRHAGGGDHAQRRAGTHRGAAIQHAGALGERGGGRQRIGVLGDRQRLAGQRRFVRLHARGLQQAQVRRHQVAAFQQHDVAPHQPLRRQLPQTTGAAHAAGGDAEPAQRLHGAHGAQLADKADDGVERDHRQDGDGLDPVPGHKTDAGRDRQQAHQQAAQLRPQDGGKAARLDGGKAVWPVTAQPLRGFGVSQTPRRLDAKVARNPRRIERPWTVHDIAGRH